MSCRSWPGPDCPWGVGFLSWAAGVGAVAQALEHDPSAVMLSFGDPGPFVDLVRETDAALIIQVTDLDEARQAVDLGADVIVAQGTEAGGHGARHGRSTLPFVPIVVDLVEPVPVLAAGGIADGRGVAAALALGAAGALVGTRFQATAEALVDPSIARALVEGRGQDTERSSVLDIARGSAWPTRYTAAPSGTPTWTAGGTARRSSRGRPRSSTSTAPTWPGASCRRCRSGRARPST